ncbi:pentapeptide repeat-containing protein, partial [Mycobacterium tuberculosis]|uniref:pentapeptide repeat-containing protein n=1 Tax=Mycobacterium tuberculosis TaxID=1773 RepID=UPI003C6E5D7B
MCNSGTNNLGLFNSGTGNVGIGNTGTGNTGLLNAGQSGRAHGCTPDRRCQLGLGQGG